ncbi:MAG: sugar phosphate isomerase/epimerase [Actinomycetota bacterium]|nr:sugar phosphate isomerase/epimerase [Actinomycetota bacterium]
MHLGVFLVLFANRPFEAALDEVVRLGLDRVEIGTGNYPGDAHCRPSELLGDPPKLAAFRTAIASRGLDISALSCHGNPLHPRPDVATKSHETFLRTVELAERLEVGVVNVFSGCPGDSDSATYPNWVTCAWPNEYGELLEWQWREKVLPYWREQARFAERHGVRLAFEMHPGFVVFNPTSLLRLRATCGAAVGANFDPSHLFWQGIDVEAAIGELGREGAIFHVHAKDTAFFPRNVAISGVLDTVPLDQVARRSWLFRTVGYGHSEIEWRRLLTALRLAGYDGTISIEHEDALLSVDEGLAKGIAFLRSVMPTEPPLASAWWA